VNEQLYTVFGKDNVRTARQIAPMYSKSVPERMSQ